MLNLQFAETMELAEAELQEVKGGDLINIFEGGRTTLPAWGGRSIGPSPYGAFDWANGLAEGLIEPCRR